MMKCIYCLNRSDNAKDNVHALLEALVKNDIVLPKGAICDPCNKYLSDLDNALITHNHIWSTIRILGLPGKTGKFRKKLGFMKRNGTSISRIM